MWKKEVLIGVATAGGAILVTGLASVLIGFGVVGITVGSIAAIIQSGIGSVVAGSAFAIGTSLGMKGCFIGAIVSGSLLLSSSLFMLNWEEINKWIQSLEIQKHCERIYVKMEKGWNYFLINLPQYQSKMQKEFNIIGNNIIYTWKITEVACHSFFKQFFH